FNKKLKTSARRYETHGIWKLQYHFWAIYVKKWFGASPDELYKYYKKHIA
ncbi:MAG TPA: glycosyl transferase family 2, partial [Xanthomarina gelatinilytica]|nr:glycosyl transferase family 2 [Xanthomarina gelatinilytica]